MFVGSSVPLGDQRARSLPAMPEYEHLVRDSLRQNCFATLELEEGSQFSFDFHVVQELLGRDEASTRAEHRAVEQEVWAR
jgi:hypothetical protein